MKLALIILTVMISIPAAAYATPGVNGQTDDQSTCKWTITIERVKLPNQGDTWLFPGLEVYFDVEIYSANSEEGTTEKLKEARYPAQGIIETKPKEEVLFGDEFAFVVSEDRLTGNELWIETKIREIDSIPLPCDLWKKAPVIGSLIGDMCSIGSGNDTLADERIVIPISEDPNGKRDYQFEHGMEATVAVFRNCY